MLFLKALSYHRLLAKEKSMCSSREGPKRTPLTKPVRVEAGETGPSGQLAHGVT